MFPDNSHANGIIDCQGFSLINLSLILLGPGMPRSVGLSPLVLRYIKRSFPPSIRSHLHHGRRSQFEEVMAPSAYVQPKARLRRRTEGSCGEEADSRTCERAAARTTDRRTTADARSCWWIQETGTCRLDVLRPLSWTNGHDGGNGSISAGKAKD